MIEGRRRTSFGLAGAVAWFEMRLQLRSAVFLIVVGIAMLMVIGSLTVERLQVGPLRPGSKTGPEAVLFIHLVWSQFFLFTAAAFAAQAALRDQASGYGPIVAAMPASQAALAAGRLGGSLAVIVLSFMSVPIALVVAPLAPWAGPLVAPDMRAIGYGLAILVTPNLVLATAAFFCLAKIARSAMAAYLGAVALLVLYGLGSPSAGDPGRLVALMDPFGFGALRSATHGWTEIERATTLPPIQGSIALNRLLWLGIAGVAALLGTLWKPADSPTRRKPVREGHSVPAFRRTGPVHRRFDLQAAMAQFGARTRLELRLVLRSPFLAVLLLLGLASAIGAIVRLPPDAARPDALAQVDDAFRLVPIVVALFWAGELVWSERDLELGDLVGSCPVPGWAILFPKVLTLLLIVSASLGSVALAASVLDAWRTGLVSPLEWMLCFALPRAVDAGLLAVLAVFLQAVAPGKLAGFGLMVLYLIGALALETTGFQGDLYRFGGSGGSLSLAQVASAHAILVRCYWGAAAVVLLLAAQLLVGRGLETRPSRRLIGAAGDLGPVQAVIVSVAALIMVLLGIVLA